MNFNCSLYLVTDSTKAILGDRDLIDIVTQAVKGGVTVVQYRDKHSDTGELIRIAKQLKLVTKEAGVPLLINDRVDVAIAVDADGVHIGQDDMDVPTARKLLGPNKIVGVTASSIDEAKKAVEQGADYLGIGTVFATPTKEDSKSIIGPAGVREILSAIADSGSGVQTVCIGGINASNLQRVLYQSHSEKKKLDGVAIVSAIIAASNPEEASRHLRQLLEKPPPFISSPTKDKTWTGSKETLIPAIHNTYRLVIQKKPLCHNMTNQVVQNFAANVALCVGGSPIMSSNGAEAADLAALGGSLVINMGTANADSMQNYKAALTAYNATGNPVLFDPVGGGATQIRRAAVKELMLAGYFTCIKGNEAEISTVYGATGIAQHGVDSGASTSTPHERAKLTRDLAARERCVALMTGAVDYLSDGQTTFAISNGHALLGEITGSGCSLGTTVAAFLACEREQPLLAALAGLLTYEIAAETAARSDLVKGPGSFVPAFLDALHLLKQKAQGGDSTWLDVAKVEQITF